MFIAGEIIQISSVKIFLEHPVALTNMSFAILDTSVIITDEYGHNDFDDDNRCNGNIGFLEI